jgi:hypothetical protein
MCASASPQTFSAASLLTTELTGGAVLVLFEERRVAINLVREHTATEDLASARNGRY